MEPKLKIIWDNLLDHLEKNTLTNAYLVEKWEPIFNYMIFKITDDLNNNILNYALIYKNLILLEFIFSKINFISLENEIKEKITEDIFSIFIALTKKIKTNLSFLVKFLDLIKDKSFKEVGNLYILQSPYKMKLPKKLKEISGKVEEEENTEETAIKKALSLFSNFDMEDKNSFKLINPLIKFFVKDCQIPKDNPFIIKIKQLYDEKYTNLIWKQMNLKKLDSKQDFYILNQIKFNILHEAIRLKKWHFFLDININILKDFLLAADISKTTPLHQIFYSADHLTISHIVKEGSHGILSDRTFKQLNARGQNLLHLLIENRRLEPQDFKQIVILLKSCFNCKEILCTPDNYNWIPLSYYLLQKFERKIMVFSDWIKQHSEIIDLLTPNPEEFDNYLYKEFKREDFWFYLTTYQLINVKEIQKDEFLKSFEVFAKSFTIFHNKFLELAFHKNSEELLLFLLKKIPNLELNTYINNYDFNLSTKTHTLSILLKRNWVSAIVTFFSKDSEKYYIDYQETAVFKYLESKTDIFKTFYEENGALKNAYFSHAFSVMNEVISGLKMIKNEAFYSKIADLLFKKLYESFQSYSQEKREKILMNVSIQIVTIEKGKNSEIEDSITLADLFELDDNQMIELFENQIKAIKTETFPYKYKLFLIKILTRKNLVLFFESSSLQKFFTFPTNDELLENELNAMFISQEFNCPVIKEIYKEIYYNPLCLHHIFNSLPKLFFILWEGNMLSLCEDILRKSFRTHQIKSKNIYGLFIKQFLSYSIEQYLSNYQINEGQKKKIFDFIKWPKIFLKNLVSLERIAKVFIKNSKIIEEFLESFKIDYDRKDKKFLHFKAINSYLFSTYADEKEKLVYFSILDNFMIKINYDEFIEKNGYLILERFIKTLEKIMTILITNHDSKESLIKVQDYLKHGFFFKPAGALLLKANLLTLHQNKDRNFIQKFLKYHMITGNNVVEYLCEDNESANLTLILQILTKTGKWQIFCLKEKRRTLLDFAAANNNLQIMSLLLNNKIFMDYYNWEDENKRSISSQSNIFFARLNRIPRTYSSNIKIRNQINENGLDVVLKSDIFPDKKETAADFSKNISLLLDHYADKIKQNTINNIEANNCLFLMKFEKKKICQNYNFILKAFPHLDLNIIKQIPLCCFDTLINNNGASTIMSLLINSIVEKEEDKIQFLKEIISNKILNQNAVSLLKTEDLNVLLESDPYFFLDIVNRLNELVEENKNKNVISYVLRCLKCLYYSEGTTFREFLKTAFIKGINLYLHKFANYIADKPLRKMNFLSIFLYIPINSIPLSVYCGENVFDEVIRDNSKELTEILQEKPDKFFELDIFSQICLNSLTNKIKTFLKTFPQIREIEGTSEKREIFKGIYELFQFNLHYKMSIIGINTCYYRKIFDLSKNNYWSLFQDIENVFGTKKVFLPKTFILSEKQSKDISDSMKNFSKNNRNPVKKISKINTKVESKILTINSTEIEKLISLKQNAALSTNRILKSNNLIEKNYTDKKRREYFENTQFQAYNSCVFGVFSEVELQNCSKFGLQNPILSLNCLMEYHLTPLIQSQNFLKHYDEIEKFLLICSPLELNLCEKFLVQLQEKLESENKGNNYSVLILQILYLVLKFNETRMAFPKNYPIAIHNYKEETHRHLILIIERLLTIPTGKIDQRTQCLIEQIICLLKSQEYYDIILKFYLFLKEKLSVDSLEEIGLNKNFLKCFLKPILIQNSYSLFKEYIFSIDDEKIESFHSLTYFESPDLTIPDIRLKLPKTKLQITEDTTYFLPNRVFSEGFSDYFIDLYKKEFNFDQIIVNYIDRNKKYQNMRLYLSKEKNHFSLLEFSVLKGLIKIFEFLMEETLSQNSEFEISYFIPLLLENGQFKIFQKMMIFLFPDNQTKIFDFIINQDLLMKIACAGNESFLLQLMKEYIIPLGSKKLIPENKLVFWTKKKDLNIKNINIFHLIAHFCMRSFLYCFLDYLLTFKFESDAIKMKYFLEEFLLMKDEETIQSSGINIQRTPIFYALKNKLYEIVNLCEIHDITFGDSPDIKELLLDLGLKNNSLGYFSKYLIANDAKDLCKVEKNNYFYERFQDHMKLLARLKAIFGSKQNNVTKKKKKNNYLEEKKKREEIIVKKKGKSKEAKIQNFEINLVLEALILGKKILEWDTSLREKVRLFLKQSKEKAILYLFLETFKSEVKNFEREDLLSIQNEAFILYLIDKFFPASKKTHEASLLNSFDIARKISLKNKSNDIMSQILLSQETINLMNLVIQKNHKLETINKEHQEVLKLKGIEIYRLLIFCLENKYYYALCYLMNLYPSEFLMIYEEYNITDSFFREYLVYNAHLSYRLLKILEKSSVYLLLEKEFNVFVETFFLFDESHNIKLLIESFKILFLLTTEEGYYNYSIFQITDAKSVEDCLLCIFRKIMTNIKNPLMVKKYLDSFSFEIRTLDLSEMLQYNYMLKTHNKQDIILKSFKAIWNYLLEENEKVKNRYHLDVDSLERFVFTIIEEKLHKIGADCKHNGVHLCLGISFMLSVLDGYGVYEELCNEFQNYEFVFYFKSETKGYNFLKNDDGKFLHVNINEEIYFDENNYALTYRFSIESYENLKVILKEETFMSRNNKLIEDFINNLKPKLSTLTENFPYLNDSTVIFDMESLKGISLCSRELILQKLTNGAVKKTPKVEILDQSDFRFNLYLGIYQLFDSLKDFLTNENNVKLFKIDDMFAPHNMQNINQTSLNNFHISQRLEGEVSYQLEIQPDATYQVKYKEAEKKKYFNAFFDDIVFSEFYEMQFYTKPEICIIYQHLENFRANMELETFYDTMMKVLISYDKLTLSKIKKNPLEQKIEEDLNLVWGYSLDEKECVVFCKDLFPIYLILKLRAIMNDFQSDIQKKINISTNFTPFRINILSFCDIFLSHILNCLKNAKEETRQRYLPNPHRNLFSIINELLEHSILSSIIFKLIRKIIIEQANVLKIIRGIYVQFKEKDLISLNEKENVNDTHLKGLNKLFRYSKTNYFIYKYMLVIEINVVKMHNSLDDEEIRDCKYKEDLQVISDSIFMVSNKFEFYETIFNNDQIISLILAKIELENQMLAISKNLSVVASKIMTISINFDNLLNILKNEYYNIKMNSTDRYAKILKYEELWNLIESIKHYFLNKAENDLIEETKESNYDDNFHILYIQMMIAYHDKKSLDELFMKNYRIYSISENFCLDFTNLSNTNGLGLLQIPLINQKNVNLLKMSFLFQIEVGDFLVNSKIGEVYILGQRKGHKKQTKIIEISSKKDGEISFINLEEKTYINARELINLNAISKSSNLKEIENIRFVFLVAKKWPELNQNTLNFKNIGITDSKMRAIFLHQNYLKKMCDEINYMDVDNYEHSLFPQLFYRAACGNHKPELTVSNLIQFIPNNLTYDFEMNQDESKQLSQTDLPPLAQSLSFARAQSIMMSINKSQNHRTIKINLNLEKNIVKCQEHVKDCFNLASKYEINLNYYFYVNSFLKKFNRLLTTVNYVKPIKEQGLDLKIELDREIDAKSTEFEEKILVILDLILDNILDAFESFLKIGYIRENKLFNLLSMLNYEFDNEHNPINYLIASLIFKYLRQIVVKFDLNSPSQELIHYDAESKSLIVSVNINEDSKEKSISFLSADEIFNSFCSTLFKEELHYISDCFANPGFKNPNSPDIVYDNKKIQYCNSNLPTLLTFIHEKKYFKRIEFINKLKLEDEDRDREKMLIFLVVFEIIIYLSICTIKVANIFNKNSFVGNSIFKCVLDFRNVEMPSKDSFLINMQLENMLFLKLITLNYNAISSLIGQSIVEPLLDCSLTYNDCILPVKKDTNMLKIKLFSSEDLNVYMTKVKISSKNAKIRSILINSSTMEGILSSSVSFDSELKIFELMFTSEKVNVFKPQKYFLNTYLNNCLIFESQVLLVKIGADNVFYPMINSLFNYSETLFLGDTSTFLINNSPNEEDEEMKESFDSPKQFKPKKSFSKNFTGYADFKIEFKSRKNNSKPIKFYLSEMLNHQFDNNLSHEKNPIDKKKLFIHSKKINSNPKNKKKQKGKSKKKCHILKNYKRKTTRVLGNDALILTKWLNTNVLLVSFSSSIISEFYFSIPDLPVPHYLVYNLKENEYEKGLNAIKYTFETKREVFYPFTKIIQVVFDDLLPKAIPKDPEEKENMHEKSIVKNEDFFLKKSNISKFMCQMNSDNFSYFFKMGDNIEILLDVPMASIQQNEKQMLENEEIKSIMLNNTLSTIRETTRDLKLYSLAGQVRKESAIFFDAEKYEIPFKEKQPITVIFAHSNYKEICFKGIYTIANDKHSIEVIWRPFIKGLYKVYFNGVFTKNYEICVLANQISRKTTNLEVPDIKTIGYFEKFNIFLQYRDNFGNIFGELEKKLLSPITNLAKVISKNPKKSVCKSTFSGIDVYGKQKIELSFVSNETNVEGLEPEDNLVQIYIMDELVKEIQIRVVGICLEKRIEKLYAEFHSLYHLHETLNISTKRMYFVEELKNLENVSFRKNLNICFEGEGGIDAGGLKREYYDMIGSSMKNATYHFFLQNPKTLKYTINPDLYKNKHGVIYMNVFGKLVANSILEKKIIGIEFALSFWKFLFGIPYEFEDLHDEFDDVTFNNYENFGKMSETDLEKIDQTFSAFSQGQEVDLIENGSKIQVTKGNVKEYLNAITKFHIETRKLNELKAFKVGFSSVITHPEILSSHLKLSEIALLTLGENQITSENIISITKFSGGNAVIISYFKRYLQEADTETLEGFVKFSTGSRSLPYDTKSYNINVSFHKTDVRKLPIAHTCSNAIEVPCYIAYEHMKKKLDVAFLYGSEGFAFG